VGKLFTLAQLLGFSLFEEEQLKASYTGGE
jgi:hypothetical protein